MISSATCQLWSIFCRFFKPAVSVYLSSPKSTFLCGSGCWSSFLNTCSNFTATGSARQLKAERTLFACARICRTFRCSSWSGSKITTRKCHLTLRTSQPPKTRSFTIIYRICLSSGLESGLSISSIYQRSRAIFPQSSRSSSSLTSFILVSFTTSMIQIFKLMTNLSV